jgi:DNA-binding protein HU-beta
MNKTELVDFMATKADMSKASAARALEAFVEAVTTQVAQGGDVVLIGFGKFAATDRKAREGRNPATGAPLKIAAARIPKFSAGAVFKATVAQAKPRARAKPKKD